MTAEFVETEIEPGVTRSKRLGERKHWHAPAGDVFTYKLRSMPPERIAHYGLTRYAEITAAYKAVGKT